MNKRDAAPKNTDLRAFDAPCRGSSKWAQLLPAAVPIFKPRPKSFPQPRDLCSLSVWQVASAALRVPPLVLSSPALTLQNFTLRFARLLLSTCSTCSRAVLRAVVLMGSTVEASSCWHHHVGTDAVKLTAAGYTLCLSDDYGSSSFKDIGTMLSTAYLAKETRQLRVREPWQCSERGFPSKYVHFFAVTPYGPPRVQI